MELELKDWGIIVSIFLSVSSFLILLWKDFIRGPILKSQINTVIQIKLPEGNQEEITTQLFLEDIQSKRPTDFAKYIIGQSQDIKTALEQKNREALITAIGNYVSGTGQSLIYVPSDDDLRKKIGTTIFNPFFYIPLQILNKGRKTGEISTLMLKIQNENQDKKWVYGCTNEVETEKFKTLNHTTKTGHLIGNLLPSITIGAQTDKRIDPLFFPINEAHDTIISRDGIGIGTYFIQVIGYNSEGKRCLETNKQKLILNDLSFFDAYRGITIMRQLFMETHIKKEITNHNSK